MKTVFFKTPASVFLGVQNTQKFVNTVDGKPFTFRCLVEDDKDPMEIEFIKRCKDASIVHVEENVETTTSLSLGKPIERDFFFGGRVTHNNH